VADRRVAVAGHLEQVGSHSVQAVVSGQSFVEDHYLRVGRRVHHRAYLDLLRHRSAAGAGRAEVFEAISIARCSDSTSMSQ
jgi:hypothetical protein